MLWIHNPIGYLPEASHPLVLEGLEGSATQVRFAAFSKMLLEQMSGTGVNASVYWLTGDFATEVPRFVENHPCDLAVLTERKGRGLFGNIGNREVARVRRRVRCNVLIVKPRNQLDRWADRLSQPVLFCRLRRGMSGVCLGLVRGCAFH